MTVSMRAQDVSRQGLRIPTAERGRGGWHPGLTTPLTRYYAEVGTPPGRWIGTGFAEFGDGQIVEGSVVTQSHLALLLGMVRDPVTGDQLGCAHQEFSTVPQRIAKRIGGIEPAPTERDREAANTKIETRRLAS